MRSLLFVAAALLFGLLAFLLWSPDRTIYVAGFSEEDFRSIRPGLSRVEVESALGEPLAIAARGEVERFQYYLSGDGRLDNDCIGSAGSRTIEVIFDEAGRINDVKGEHAGVSIPFGMTKDHAVRDLGEPCVRFSQAAVLWYSRPGEDGLFRARGVELDSYGLVEDLISYEFHD